MKRFGLIGGDRRQSFLAELLERDGHTVTTYGLAEWVGKREAPLQTVAGAEVVLLPLPLSREAGRVNCAGTPLETRTLFRTFSPGQLALAGQVGEAERREAEQAGVELIDYFLREELAVANAVPSAEGAIQTAMARLPVTLCGLPCLVIGYGRIGKLLAHRLAGLGARVSVSARKHSDRAWISAFGWEALDTRALSGRLGGFGVVFNTVPAPILSAGQLGELPPGCLYVELASVPGTDLAAAEAMGIQTVWARGLPGKVAPAAAAAAIRDAVYHILEERGESV